MKKYIVLFILGLMGIPRLYAQQEVEEALARLSAGKQKPEPQYSFSSNVTYKLKTTDKKKKEQWMTSKYYFSDKGTYIGMKILDGNDLDQKRAASGVDFIVFDISQARMFNFMNNNGSKMVMGFGLKPDKLEEIIEKENDKITVNKTAQTRTILGYECEGFAIQREGDKSEVTLWVSKKKVETFAQLGKQMAGAFSGNSRGKQVNYYAYNAHPELVKLAKEGRAVLGYTSVTDKGETIEMELTDIQQKEHFEFNSSSYKSMF